jgi:NADH:ubiquinone oxidoreductase subunit K
MTPILVPEFYGDENQTVIDTQPLTTILIVIASGVAAISVALLVYFKKHNHKKSD